MVTMQVYGILHVDVLRPEGGLGRILHVDVLRPVGG